MSCTPSTDPGKIEILSPAGGPEALTAAVNSGADAVYLGAAAFSARANAENFDDDALRGAVEYCHARGVRVYLTVNTLLHDDELAAALAVVRTACALGVDSILVQDMGLFAFLRQSAPQLTLHASTQMSICSPAGAQMLYELGLRRIVLARELSLQQIEEIHRSTDAQLEAFIHGALCMCVSGQCYFSAMLGSRSGNRGLCAQPCRLPFENGGNPHALSLKDLSFINGIQTLQNAGICCAKIEGRMKRPEYVAAATAACRTAWDTGSVPPEQAKLLQDTFSRSGFTDGYLTGKTGYAMFGTRTKEDVTAATEAVFRQLRGTFQKEYKRIAADLAFTMRGGEPLALTVTDGDGYTVTVTGPLPEPALNRELSRARCEEQLGKTGDSPFFVRSCHTQLSPGLTCPVSALNALRRDAFAQLLALRKIRPAIAFTPPSLSFEPHDRRQGALALRGFFTDAAQVPQNAGALQLVVLPVTRPAQEFSRLLEAGLPVCAALPRAVFGWQQVLLEQIAQKRALGVADFYCPTLDSVAIALKAGAQKLHGGFSLNITNTAALQQFAAMGLCDAELSPELTFAQCQSIGGSLARGTMVYGRLPLMVCRNCPAAATPKGCLHCTAPAVLTDRKGVQFPVLCTGAPYFRLAQVYNSVPTHVGSELYRLDRTDFGSLHFTVENPVECEAVINDFLQQKKTGAAYTRGLFHRGVQ